MQYSRVVVIQIERVGYLCGRCNRFHRHNDPLYHGHLVSAVEGLTLYEETRVYGIDDATGQVERLPVALGLAAMEGAEVGEG